mmetsp:Transcript_26421/g.66426  ORF Transcript_26421/g.66426 Transcript_26421/m.66426 type:complete len:381 (+) Transcript_26421:414-1556(+)
MGSSGSANWALAARLVALVGFLVAGQTAAVGLQHAFQEHAAGVDPESYPALSAASSWVMNREIGVNESMPWEHPGKYLTTGDGWPYIFPTPNHRDILICIPQKLGSTRWNAMFRRVYAPATPVSSGSVHGRVAPWTTLEGYGEIEQLMDKMQDPATLRFMWVRNPYTRLVSAFLDKICGRPKRWLARIKELGGGKLLTCDAAGFLKLLQSLNSMADRGEHMKSLFALQKDRCGLPYGMQYDYFLKVEHEAEWYPEFVSMTGLADVARHGWAEGASKLGVPECFMELPGLTCKETDEYIRSLGAGPRLPPKQTGRNHVAAGGLLNPMSAQSAEVKKALHATGSAARMKELYATQEAVDLATRYLRPDLEAFGYPVMEAVEA